MAKSNKKQPAAKPPETKRPEENEVAKAIEDQGPIAVAVSIALFARDLRLDELFAKFQENPSDTEELTRIIRKRYGRAIQNRRLDIETFVTLTKSMAAALSAAVK